MKMRIFICLLLAVSMTAACSRPKLARTVGLNEEFTVKKDEVVNIVGTEINVKMMETSVQDGGLGDDVNVCTVEITYKGEAEEEVIEEGKFVSHDEFNVKLEKANLATDPAKTSCTFFVAKTMG